MLRKHPVAHPMGISQQQSHSGSKHLGTTLEQRDETSAYGSEALLTGKKCFIQNCKSLQQSTIIVIESFLYTSSMSFTQNIWRQYIFQITRRTTEWRYNMSVLYLAGHSAL